MLEVLLVSDMADVGDCWGGITPGGGGDIGPKCGSVEVLGVTFQGVVALAENKKRNSFTNNDSILNQITGKGML